IGYVDIPLTAPKTDCEGPMARDQNNEVVVVFTRYNADTIRRGGGTGEWRLNPNVARQCRFAVCTRKTPAPSAKGHGAAFLGGRVKDVVPAFHPYGRYTVQFSEVAVLDKPNVWKSWNRNPVRYVNSLKDLGINPSKLKWEPMPDADDSSDAGVGAD